MVANPSQGGNMFKRILVAVDASQTGELALQTAIGLAAEMQARLRIVHAVDMTNVNMIPEFPTQPETSKVAEEILKDGQEILRGAEATAAAAGLAVETNLVRIDTQNQHNISETIANDAEAWPADLIVIGTHGRRGLRRLFLGSVAEGVARVATTPVLLIREK
jgi:nucleotide-binding universal stress UspA family protein